MAPPRLRRSPPHHNFATVQQNVWVTKTLIGPGSLARAPRADAGRRRLPVRTQVLPRARQRTDEAFLAYRRVLDDDPQASRHQDIRREAGELVQALQQLCFGPTSFSAKCNCCNILAFLWLLFPPLCLDGTAGLGCASTGNAPVPMLSCMM